MSRLHELASDVLSNPDSSFEARELAEVAMKEKRGVTNVVSEDGIIVVRIEASEEGEAKAKCFKFSWLEGETLVTCVETGESVVCKTKLKAGDMLTRIHEALIAGCKIQEKKILS